MSKTTLHATLAALLATLLGAVTAGAVSLNLLPASQTAAPGDTVSLDLVISGLGDHAAPSLGDFDIDVSFDPSRLSFAAYGLGNGLGDVAAGEAWDLSLGDVGGGVVNLAELSLLDANPNSGPSFSPPYLDDIQAGSFVLASLDFLVEVLPPGSLTTVGIAATATGGSSAGPVLGDGLGNPLALDSAQGAVIFNPSPPGAVPEPATLVLYGLGGAGLLLGLRRRV